MADDELKKQKMAESENYEQLEAFEEEEQLTQEEDMANQLAAEQEYFAAVHEAEAIAQRGQKFKKPSIIKYAFLFFVAFIADLVDLIEFTGAGIPFNIIISIVLTLLLVLVSWLTNGQAKKAENYIKSLPKELVEIQTRVAQASRLALRLGKLGRRIRRTRGVSNKLLKSMGKFRRYAAKSPVLRVLLGGGLDIIPFIDIIPFNLIGVYLAYRIEKGTLNEASTAGDNILKDTLENGKNILG